MKRSQNALLADDNNSGIGKIICFRDATFKVNFPELKAVFTQWRADGFHIHVKRFFIPGINNGDDDAGIFAQIWIFQSGQDIAGFTSPGVSAGYMQKPVCESVVQEGAQPLHAAHGKDHVGEVNLCRSARKQGEACGKKSEAAQVSVNGS